MASHIKITNTQYKLTKWHIDKWKNSLNYIRNGNKLLDIGCADCTFFDYIKKRRTCDYCGNDIDKYALQIAKIKGYTFVDDLNKIKSNFDIITMWEIIEHLSLNDFLEKLSWCKTHLKENGKLIISTPNILNPFYPFWAEPTHIRPYSMDSLVNVLESEGFEIIIKKETHPLVHPLKIIILKLLGISKYSKLYVVAKLKS